MAPQFGICLVDELRAICARSTNYFPLKLVFCSPHAVWPDLYSPSLSASGAGRFPARNPRKAAEQALAQAVQQPAMHHLCNMGPDMGCRADCRADCRAGSLANCRVGCTATGNLEAECRPTPIVDRENVFTCTHRLSNLFMLLLFGMNRLIRTQN